MTEINTSYLGRKGYTVLKNELTEEKIKKIKSDLTVRPFVPKSPIPMPSFPVYRESSKKLYLPRYYGINELGLYKTVNLNIGDDINVKFNGELRDYQINIVNKYTEYISDSGGGLLEVDTGLGKTVIALNIISKIKKKTLIIVHKEFLMSQWIERINEFLPDMKVGKIQGKKIETEGNDICIAMLQSLSMKTYKPEQFDSFGFTILDEVHHLGAEVFSQALFNVVTNYVLGLSATMERKDGLTKIFKHFLGDIIHKEKRDTSKTTVLVKSIEYIANDEEFNEIIYDYRGNAAYSKMITKLCNFNHRTEFILEVLKRILKENNDQQVMILAHNKSILKYIYEGIKHKEIGEVGYYMGGMKQQDLKESENKQIIVGTYAMASEGLDIKTLTTLIMATPKSDVIQTVGRILRSNHKQPMVIDIIDTHNLFKRQYYQRRRYYNKQKYIIERYTSKSYLSNTELDKDDDDNDDNDDKPAKCEIPIKCMVPIKK